MPAPRVDVARILAGIALTDLMFRVAQVGVPLLVLEQTGSPGLTGLSAGATAVPVLLSPWWARGLRTRIRSGRAIAWCYLGEAGSLAVIPAAAACGQLSAPVLLVAGLLLGCFETVDGPARDGLVADLGDQLGPDRPFALLSTRDFLRRVAMVAGPALGGVGVALLGAAALLWLEVGSVVVAAGLTTTVRGGGGAPPGAQQSPSRIWPVVLARPEILLGWVVRGTGCALWFAFTLGLALLGVAQGRPGVLVAVGLAGYGIGSLVGTPVAVAVARRLPALLVSCAAWALTGMCWVLMGRWSGLGMIAAAAAVSGVLIAVGNGCATALVVRATVGAERRTLLAGQSVVVNGASAGGLLVGGPLLAVLGPNLTLVLAGAALAVVAIGVGVGAGSGRAGQARSPAASVVS